MTGTLTIETMEANGAPVNQAAIRVYERTDSASKFIMGCYTDEKGLSEPITLLPQTAHIPCIAFHRRVLMHNMMYKS